MKSIILLFVSTVLTAQIVGTVSVTPGTPPQLAKGAELLAVSGLVRCRITGESFPATSVTIAWTVRGTVLAPETYAPAIGDAYVITRSLVGGDSVGVTIRRTAGGITVEASANTTPPTIASF